MKQYSSIQGAEWKNIINNIIKQYRKIDEPTFQTRLNTKVLAVPNNQSFCKWIVDMIKWTIDMRQDLISCNLWPRLDVASNQELTLMPMHKTSSWSNNKSKPTTSTLGGPSTPTKKIPSPVTASAITDNRSVIRYDIMQKIISLLNAITMNQNRMAMSKSVYLTPIFLLSGALNATNGTVIQNTFTMIT
jgi:hypothetical protein